MTWALMTLLGLGWLFRRPIGRALAPHLPTRAQRHAWLGIAIAAFLIVALLRVMAMWAGF
jgi:hypothetical protein